MTDHSKDSKDNAPKGSEAKRDGITTNQQSGTSTGVSAGNAMSGLNTPITSPSQPAGTPPGTGEGRQRDTSKVFNETVEKEGETVRTSSVSRQDASKASDINLAKSENLTQALEGVPGNVDLTQGGTLNSDKSVRDDRSLDEKNRLLNETSGPNPTPNRDGNELTKGLNAMSAVGGPQFIGKVDRDTSALASRVQAILNSGDSSLKDSDRKELESVVKELRETGRI